MACGKLVSRFKLPAILGWLIAGVVLGPYLAGVVTLQTTDALWYKVMIKCFECFAGVMIGREIVFRKLARSGKQIIGITFVQSIGTFLFVSLVFGVVFAIVGQPVWLGLIFGGIALATAPAPALSIVNEYHTSGPVTRTLIPLAAIDDVIGVIVFFTVISVVSAANSSAQSSVLSIAGMVCLPFVIGIATGALAHVVLKSIKSGKVRFVLLLVFLCLSSGWLSDRSVRVSFVLPELSAHRHGI